MKKIFILVFLIISAVASAQLSTVNIGAAANDGTGDPLRTAFGKINIAIDSVNNLLGGLPIEDYAVMLLPDTTHVTDPTYTVVVGDQEVYFTDSFVLVTLPTNATAAIPVGSTINFFSYAGLIKFAAEAGAVLKSAQDSVTTSKAYQVVGAKKVATNKWWIYGPLEN